MATATAVHVPSFRSYGDYSSSNYGVNSMLFVDTKGREFYFSYKTLVAFRSLKTGLVCRKNEWGVTTGKHLNWIQPDHKARVSSEEFDQLLETI